MCRFSSAATRASSLSATGSSVNPPVLRWLIRVASSWKLHVGDHLELGLVDPAAGCSVALLDLAHPAALELDRVNARVTSR